MNRTFYIFLALFYLLNINILNAQTDPSITAWKINTNGSLGYDSIPSNVQKVEYADSNVYVSVTCIPDYTIGPWQGNPNVPTDKNFVFKITRYPKQDPDSTKATPLGHIGIWSNGVSIFNAKDGKSYQNGTNWHQDALFHEASTFDNCLGHPDQSGEYHNHVNPKCLYDDTDSSKHSPILGFAFDGFPIYGAYAYKNPNGTGGITRMKSSYGMNTSPTRLNGPYANSSFPRGKYVEDYSYVPNQSDLDRHNGRFSITPEYPNGTYAYFLTINEFQEPVYPYVVGPTYYGTVQAGNTGPGSGKVTIAEPVTTYNPPSGMRQNSQKENQIIVFPNPAQNSLTVVKSENIHSVELFNNLGQIVLSKNATPHMLNLKLNLEKVGNGIYFLKAVMEEGVLVEKIIISK